MGKKGSKRKTRWRTLSIGAPPGEEDDEEGLQNGYMKGQENDSSTHSFDRNSQGGYKPWRMGTGSGSSNYAGGRTRSHKDESSGSPSQPKMIFNEDEYTRITTPRQDMLFKKGYLSRRKPWTGNASTSATPSTTESQSASHSTADGSETTEDQQLLDRDSGSGEYPPVMEPEAQLGYGTFYDHASGYYYDYPVMLVGPAPVPHVVPNVLTAVPCGPVPLRPIEWINPAFVPKLAGQCYSMMDYQSGQSTENTTVVEELEAPLLPADNSNGTCNASGTGSASCSGSVAGETEEQPAENTAMKEHDAKDYQVEEQMEEFFEEEQHLVEQPVENGVNGGPYLEPVLMQRPVPVSHVIPAVPQPYMYPGHYMFGPPLVNINGVTIQGGPMIRTMDVAAVTAACAKRRKKKRRRKQRKLATGNPEDEEEEEYSSECDTGLPSSRLSWTECSTSTTTTTNNRPLNPECQEFQLQPAVEPSETSAVSTSNNATNSVDKSNEPCNGVISDDPKNQDDELITNGNSRSLLNVDDPDNEENRLINSLIENEEPTQEVRTPLSINVNKAENDSSSANEIAGRNHVEKEILVNGKADSDSNNEEKQTVNMEKTSRPPTPVFEKNRSRSATPKIESLENHESLSNSKSSATLPKKKYSAKGAKFVREPTPGPDLDCTVEPENDKTLVQELNQSVEVMNLTDDSLTEQDSSLEHCDQSEEHLNENVMKVDTTEAANEDSGFESQTRLSDYPITEAVTEWLRRANSPDMFVSSTNSVNSETTDDKEPEEEEPPKNLQGNPILALSANSGADDSRATSCGEFARINNVKGQEQLETSRRRNSKRRSRLRHADGRLDNDAISSSDSCGQREYSTKKNPTRQPDVGEVCEFTEKDSVVGMRVASSSRMDSKRVNARRARKRTIANNEDAKFRHIEDVVNENDEGIVDDSMNVKTFEKGEIVVSEDGKLLTTLWGIKSASKRETIIDANTETEEKCSSGEEENGNISFDSIEEPDVLECWETETIEPVITLKRMLQSPGTQCEGEAAEEDTLEAEVHVDYIQKYYRLARNSATSVEEETISSFKASVDSSASQSVPNHSEVTGEQTPAKKVVSLDQDGPIDEAFEVYESYYTEKPTPFQGTDSKVFKSKMYGQDGEAHIPCRAVCCDIQ